ncbi:structural protein [Pseudomonas putida]|uniref:structural protein n=1 Tax=Pseudomonas putida TaxID=303 RepID=UPI000C2B012A|nr:structural protein [Pseudomonas putida]PJX09053.1 structural protein [Pseudomonas putida]
MSTARGVRNNNPGNIDYSPANKWNGQLGLEEGVAKPRFARFDTPENGIRALGKLLQTYQRVYGLNTVAKIINRWAPSSENDTAAYVRSVEQRIGSAPGAKIQLTDPATLKGFVVAIIIHENAGNPYTDAVISEGVRRALA